MAYLISPVTAANPIGINEKRRGNIGTLLFGVRRLVAALDFDFVSANTSVSKERPSTVNGTDFSLCCFVIAD
jgi:hypothetical protein